MEDIHQRLAALGLAIPEITLPRRAGSLEQWAVIACDQFTQDRAYWEAVRRQVGDEPSTLNMIFPEIYLEDPDHSERISLIHRTMADYLRGDVFAPPRKTAVYIERATTCHPLRRGLVLALDLEEYDWAPGSRSLIRATEGTVKERLPPRMEIRRGAPLELPHILILIDDEEDTLLPALGEGARKAPPLYDTPLMMDSGHIRGWALDQPDDWQRLASGLEKLCRRAETRYAVGHNDAGRDSANGGRPFLYAVGDGNHSLATAKAVWEEYKRMYSSARTFSSARMYSSAQAHAGEPCLMDHPARWALVELENLYDPGIAFEPIHRILFGPAIKEVLSLLGTLPGFTRSAVPDGPTLSRLTGDPAAPKIRLGLIAGKELVLVEYDSPGIATGSLQPLLDRFLQDGGKGRPPYTIDYIHGEEELFRLAGGPEAVGILLPPVKKSGLFSTVAQTGPLPRKSFSMGEACEKRFYLECRKLFG